MLERSWSLAGGLIDPSAGDDMDPRIADVIAHMEQALEQPLTIAGLSAAINLSPSRLAHLFTRETGIAPGRYLHALRMRRARVLLERTFLSVKQVMACVGIHDPSHFARDFRRFHGVPPSAVRQQAPPPDGVRLGSIGPATAADGHERRRLVRRALDGVEPAARAKGEQEP
jgi:AraC family transcriptional regulator of arabinose operon